MWPLVIYHKVGELSPLYTLHPEHLDKESFEIIVKVSGVRSENGGTIFSTTSYTNTISARVEQTGTDCLLDKQVL